MVAKITYAQGISQSVPNRRINIKGGFELFIPADQAEHVGNACLEAGQAAELMAIGLGARDTLRLGAGYLLYGNYIDAETTPLEAGLQRLVRFEGAPFVGREALRKQQVEGIKITGWDQDGRCGNSAPWVYRLE